MKQFTQDDDFEDAPQTPVEARLRELLSRQAQAVRTSEAPLDAIVRRGRSGRRLRAAMTASALAMVIAVPVGAYAVSSGDNSPVAKDSSRPSQTSGTKVEVPPAHTPKPTPSGPAAPATPEQLVDGITYEQAADGLEKCLAHQRAQESALPEDYRTGDLGKPEDYRILLAHRMTGDDNAPGDGIWVVATTEKPRANRVLCALENGEASGFNSGLDPHEPEYGAVYPDLNDQRLHKQRIFTGDGWRLPYRWGNIGQVRSEVERVTVTYGDRTVEAAVDHGWYAATGIAEEQPRTAPHIKGYDASGKEIYDSTADKYYSPALPKS